MENTYNKEFMDSFYKKLKDKIKTELVYLSDKEREVLRNCSKAISINMPVSLGWNSMEASHHTTIKDPDKWNLFFNEPTLMDIINAYVLSDFNAISRKKMMSIASGEDKNFDKNDLALLKQLQEASENRNKNNTKKIMYSRPLRKDVMVKVKNLNASKISKIG